MEVRPQGIGLPAAGGRPQRFLLSGYPRHGLPLLAAAPLRGRL